MIPKMKMVKSKEWLDAFLCRHNLCTPTGNFFETA